MNVDGRRGNVSVSMGFRRRAGHVDRRKRSGRKALKAVVDTFETDDVRIRVVLLRFFLGGDGAGISKRAPAVREFAEIEDCRWTEAPFHAEIGAVLLQHMRCPVEVYG